MRGVMLAQLITFAASFEDRPKFAIVVVVVNVEGRELSVSDLPQVNRS